jgi:hypothetical protein
VKDGIDLGAFGDTLIGFPVDAGGGVLQQRFHDAFLTSLSINGSWWYAFVTLGRWVGLRLDLVASTTLAGGTLLAMTLVAMLAGLNLDTDALATPASYGLLALAIAITGAQVPRGTAQFPVALAFGAMGLLAAWAERAAGEGAGSSTRGTSNATTNICQK